MIQLADDFFSVKNDPSQLSVDEEVLQQLNDLHPSTLSEEIEDDGPICWILMIPSSLNTMNDFLSSKITEAEILHQALESKKRSEPLEAIYLCSALVLPEFRNKGIAKRLSIDAIESIRKDFPIHKLYSWPFSNEGEKLSSIISQLVALPLLEKKSN